MTRWWLVLSLAVAVAGCNRPAPSPPPAAPEGVGFTDTAVTALPGWGNDTIIDALPALRSSCSVFAKKPDEAWIGSGPAAVRAVAWKAACADLDRTVPSTGTLDPPAFRVFLESRFKAMAVTGPAETASSAATSGATATGLFTGYYQPELIGCTERTDVCKTPLYGPPADLVTVDMGTVFSDMAGQRLTGRVEGGRLVSYWTRAEIEAGALGPGSPSEAPVVAWAADPVDAHILSIQGSGRIKLPDGSTLQLAYAGNNGRPFKGIGKILADQGVLAPGEATMPAVHDWLEAHPAEATAAMRQNPRYIFFRRLDGPGPIGTLGVPLVAGRSIAVDPSVMPLGAPVWIDTSDADGHPLRRLMVAADTGAAIKGAVRGDVFWGNDEPSFAIAGRMKSPGSWFLLIPKG